MVTKHARQLTVASYIVCFLAWLLLSSPWLLGDITIPYDAKAQFHAQLQFLANAIHSGQSPFWNPNEFGGSPQIADPQSLIFSPAILIALLSATPGVGAVDAFAFVLLAVAALAVLGFFHDRGWHPIGGVVAALAFSFGASAAWRIQHIGQIQSYALFAVTLWLLSRALDRQSVVWGVAAGLAAGLMVVAPDQVALLAAYVLAGYAVAHIARQERPWLAIRALTPTLVVAALAAAILAVIPIALTYLFLEGSNRPEVTLAEAGRGSLHPASLLTAVVGDLFGALDPKVEYWGPHSAAWDPSNTTLSQNMGQLYVGALPILLILTIGCFRGQAWTGEIRYFSVALAAMVVYALGIFTPVFGLLYDFVPGVRYFRRPADATFLIGALLAIVGGYLAHRVATGSVPRASTVRRGAEFAALMIIFAISIGVALHLGRLSDVVRPLVVAAGCVAAAAALGLVLPRLSGHRPLAGLAAVAGFMIADMAINNGPNDSTALPIANYEFLKPDCKNETIRFLKARLKQPPGSNRRDRVELVGLGFSWPNAGLVHGFDHVLGYNPLRLDVVTRAVGAGDTIAGWDQRKFTALFRSYRSLLSDMLGLRYIAAAVPIERIDSKLQRGDLLLIARTKDAYIYENPRALPRAMFVGDWQTADFEQLIETGSWPIFDPRSKVLLETAPENPGGSGTHKDASSPIGAPHVSIADYQNTVVEIDVSTPRPGFVLLNDVWHPWWRATVDGEPVEILKANVMFRAVQVPPGHHHVRFIFEPIAGAIAEALQPPPATIARRLKWRRHGRAPEFGPQAQGAGTASGMELP